MTELPEKMPAFEAGAKLLQREARDPDMRRPAPTVVGAALVLLRALVGGVVLVGLMSGWDAFLLAVDSAVEVLGFAAEGAPWVRSLVFGLGGLALLFQVVLAVLIFLGHNGARVLIMVVAVVDITTTFFAWSVQGHEITLSGTLYSLALDILILLALSSQAAAAYARRNEPIRAS